MSKTSAACLAALAAALAVCLLILGGALDVTIDVHIPPAFLRRNPGSAEKVLEIDFRRQEEDIDIAYDEPHTHRKLQGMQLSHSRQPKYSIYTGKYQLHFQSLYNMTIMDKCSGMNTLIVTTIMPSSNHPPYTQPMLQSA